MSFRRTWKDALLVAALAFAWMPLGCGEAPPPAPSTPAPTADAPPQEPVKASKGKKKSPDDDMGIAEKREMRRKAQGAGGAP